MMTTLANELPNGQAQLLNGLAHMAPVEAPEFIAKVLAAFLE
jgi:pimeloyl-ACP methyl ester carboxylesterase